MEEAQGKSVRCPSNNPVTLLISNLLRGRSKHDPKHASRQPQREERHRLAAESLAIGRRRKTHVRRVSVETYVPGIFSIGVANSCSPQPFPSSPSTVDGSVFGGVLKYYQYNTPHLAVSLENKRHNNKLRPMNNEIAKA
jgi:hypothetical protein